MDAFEQAEDNLRLLITRVEADLRLEIFSDSTVNMIEIIRFITDLKTVGAEIAKKGSVLLGSLRATKYVQYLRQVTHTLNEITDAEIKHNYKSFLKKLEIYLKQKDRRSFSSIDIIKDFLNTELKLFEGVEITI